MQGAPIRQDYLETVISWISDGNIEQYMAQNQHEPTANPIWLYFQAVIGWVGATFPKYRKEMKGLPWGTLYNRHHKDRLDPKGLEEEIAALMIDDEVTKRKGVYEYVLTRDRKFLSLRAFTEAQRRSMFERQVGVCSSCKLTFTYDQMEADHITPWSEGGRTSLDNGQMLCKDCNRRKSNT